MCLIRWPIMFLQDLPFFIKPSIKILKSNCFFISLWRLLCSIKLPLNKCVCFVSLTFRDTKRVEENFPFLYPQATSTYWLQWLPLFRGHMIKPHIYHNFKITSKIILSFFHYTPDISPWQFEKKIVLKLNINKRFSEVNTIISWRWVRNDNIIRS